jgi:hypothetical protein
MGRRWWGKLVASAGSLVGARSSAIMPARMQGGVGARPTVPWIVSFFRFGGDGALAPPDALHLGEAAVVTESHGRGGLEYGARDTWRDTAGNAPGCLRPWSGRDPKARIAGESSYPCHPASLRVPGGP